MGPRRLSNRGHQRTLPRAAQGGLRTLQSVPGRLSNMSTHDRPAKRNFALRALLAYIAAVWAAALPSLFAAGFAQFLGSIRTVQDAFGILFFVPAALVAIGLWAAVPYLVAVLIARRYGIRTPVYFVAWGIAVALSTDVLLAIAGGRSLPADDPEHMSFTTAFLRFLFPLALGGLAGGWTAWLVLCGRKAEAADADRDR